MANFDNDDERIRSALATARAGKLAEDQLERTLGRALLQRMTGQSANLSEIFRRLGGTDEGVLAMFDAGLNDVFQTLPLDGAIERAREAALSDPVRTAVTSQAAKNVQAALTPLVREEDQALHTLAGLAGDEFLPRYSP